MAKKAAGKLEAQLENALVTVQNGQMTIVVDLTKKVGPSGSGKSMTVATSRGIKYMDASAAGGPGNLGIGLNLFVPNQPHNK